MYLRSVECLCVLVCFVGVACQRSWGSNGGYNSGFSSAWNTGYLGGNPQSFGGNKQNGFGNSFGQPSRGSGSSAGSVNFNGKPAQGQYSSGNEKNPNWGGLSGTNSGNSGAWQSDAFNVRPTEGKSSPSKWGENNNPGLPSWGSGKPSSGANSNQNSPGDWNSNAINNNNFNNYNENDVFNEADYEDNSVSSWNSNNKKKSKPGSGFYGGSEKWETTTPKSNKNSGAKWESGYSNKPAKSSGTNNWGSNVPVRPSGTDNWDSNASSKPSKPSGTDNWGSNVPGRPSGTDNWDSNASSKPSKPSGTNIWGSNGSSKPSKPSGTDNWGSNGSSKPSKPSGTDNWGSNGSSKPSKPSGTDNWGSNGSSKPSKPSGTDNWGSNVPARPSGADNWGSNASSNPGKDKTPTNTDQQTSTKPSTVDTSILDELDKNDWYFGQESNYPKPPFKSTLNIDVSELWNFDKNRRKTNQNFRESTNNTNKNKNTSSNNKRRNRQIGHPDDVQEGIQCECVNVNFCDEEDMIISRKDLRFDSRPLQAFRCRELSEVCCTNPKTGISSRVNLDEEEEQLGCGQRKIGENPFRKFSVNIAAPGEFPWMLSLENTENCSATLIHHRLAVTAAHCTLGAVPNELILKAGIWNSNDEPPQTRKVSRIIPHPDYSSQRPRNDITLLVVEEPFQLTGNVNPVCLPVTNDKWDPSRCVVAGRRGGKIGGRGVEVVEKGVVSFLPQAECQNIMLVTDLWRDYVLHESFVCGTEKSGRQSCTGDEGGFVICPSKKRPDTYLQIGVVSEGMNCDNFGRPGIFTNVLKFLDWINQNYLELGLYDDIDIRSLARNIKK